MKNNSKYHWMHIWNGDVVEVESGDLKEALQEVLDFHGCDLDELQSSVSIGDAILLRSSDGVNFTKVKVIAPKDDWSVEIWSK